MGVIVTLHVSQHTCLTMGQWIIAGKKGSHAIGAEILSDGMIRAESLCLKAEFRAGTSTDHLKFNVNTGARFAVFSAYIQLGIIAKRIGKHPLRGGGAFEILLNETAEFTGNVGLLPTSILGRDHTVVAS
ncbi:MAG: hypothetical protein EA353_13630 [Puniceicoccaceae bacterium]|nr:MAG: hypothetical protein EA353_13630 [Puniceicoccaceae bacterium]